MRNHSRETRNPHNKMEKKQKKCIYPFYYLYFKELELHYVFLSFRRSPVIGQKIETSSVNEAHTYSTILYPELSFLLHSTLSLSTLILQDFSTI